MTGQRILVCALILGLLLAPGGVSQAQKLRSSPVPLRSVANAPVLPDLIVTDIWPVGQAIHYQLWNAGAATAPAGHYTGLTIDGFSFPPDSVNVALAPGERAWRTFPQYGWACSGISDTIKACADAETTVWESDDNNNCREETWKCDTTPPTITLGPVVSEILQTSVVVVWTTDEDSDSVVEFGRYAGEYEDQEGNTTLSVKHEIALTGLEPSTVYHYVVKSTDASSNTVTSTGGFFETAPVLPGEPPGLSSLAVTRVEGDRELYRVTLPVADAPGIGRVGFYMDGTPIGIDYSADLLPGAHLNAGLAGAGRAAVPQYESYLDPAFLEMSREGFFGTTHMMAAKAIGLSGLSAETSCLWTPDLELADIHLGVWPAYIRPRYVEGPGGTLPEGTIIDVSAWAYEDEWDCEELYSGPYGEIAGWDEPRCSEVERSVARVVFSVDGTRVYTSYPSGDDDFYHEYPWNVSGLGEGTYTIGVWAYARDGSTAYRRRTLTVEQGEPSLEVSRSVTRVDNYFRVELTVENQGTASGEVGLIKDNVTGFQPIIASTMNYSVSLEYQVATRQCDVEIDVFEGTADAITLAPGESIVVEYLAVPILYADSDTFEYGMGSGDDIRVWGDRASERWRFDRPGELTTDGELLVDEIAAAKAASDYLIVTHPDRLFLFNANDAEVNELLARMAELAQLKTGILGYLAVWSAGDVRDTIVGWGSGMKGSDGVDGHYLSNGYLLLVGETEIIGSWRQHISRGRGSVHDTDLPYGNTSGDWTEPELVVGRVIGNSAASLTIPIVTSVNVHNGEPGFEFHRLDASADALLVSGDGEGVNTFENSVDDVEDRLDDEFVVQKLKLRDVEESGGNITTEFKAHDADRDVVYYRDHCSSNSWTDVIGIGDFGGTDPVDFEDSKPFAFACCCKAGQYEDDDDIGIAETFLEHGAAVYIGATEKSDRLRNNAAARNFFDRWIGSLDSVAKAFRDFKRGFNNRIGRRYWIAEYNLYGDPKYGSIPAGATALSMPEITVSGPITSLEVVVPDYEITTTLGITDHVTIPGGGILLEPDQPVVPFYTVDVDYPSGYRVQDVILTGRSGLTTTTGLYLPGWTIAWDYATSGASPLDSGDGWWPEEMFEWSIRENVDGSSTLVVTVYPFYYNPLTTNAEFYKNHSFDILVSSSTVEVASLTTDENAYPQGDDVSIDLWLNNSGAAQDVIVQAVVKAAGSGEVVDGLLLHSLKALTGMASFSSQWDSTGFEPGYYYVEAEVRDTAGNVLHRKLEQFRLGVCSGEVTTFTATPTFFDIGDTIDVSLVFSNAGTVPITGTAVIQVQDETGEIVQEFRHDVANLAPASSTAFDDAWDTSGAEGGSYRVVGYVLYDSRATSIEVVTVSTEAYIYLPAILKNLQ